MQFFMFGRLRSGLGLPLWLGMALLLLGGCATTTNDTAGRAPATESRSLKDVLEPERQMSPQASRQMIDAGLAKAVEAFGAGERLRPYAAVYSSLVGIRPVRLNDNDRQASDSDTDLLLESIRALSSGSDLEAFAVFGLAMDTEGRRWFVVHYESRAGTAEMRQYPVPPPQSVDAWSPALVESVRPVIY